MRHTSEEIKYRLSDLGVQIGNIAIEYIAELEKENAELKATNKRLLESCEGATMMYKHLTKAKKLLKDITSSYGSTEVSEAQFYLKIKKAEIFLKETE